MLSEAVYSNNLPPYRTTATTLRPFEYQRNVTKILID